jgi:hypothetical protein
LPFEILGNVFTLIATASVPLERVSVQAARLDCHSFIPGPAIKFGFGDLEFWVELGVNRGFVTGADESD